MMIVEKIINTAFIKRQLKKIEKAKRENRASANVKNPR